MSRKDFQAKHLRDVLVLELVRELKAQPTPWGTLPGIADYERMCERLDGIPPKVVWAKLQALVKRGLLEQWGAQSFELTEAGEALRRGPIAVDAAVAARLDELAPWEAFHLD